MSRFSDISKKLGLIYGEQVAAPVLRRSTMRSHGARYLRGPLNYVRLKRTRLHSKNREIHKISEISEISISRKTKLHIAAPADQ